MRRPRPRTVVAATAALVLAGASCSAGDPPDPDAARATATRPVDAVESSSTGAAPREEHGHGEAELSDAEDATLDALEERFEDRGVKDIRGEPGAGVTIRLEDELSPADAAPFCAAVRQAGFAQVRVDIDGDLGPCP